MWILILELRPDILYAPELITKQPEKRTDIYRKFGLVGRQICYAFTKICNGIRRGSRTGLQASISLLNPTGHVMHQQFNIQQLYALPTLYLCVLYLSENKQRLVSLTA